MRLVLVLTFVAVFGALAVLWPDPLPRAPEPVQGGLGMTHQEAAALNLHQFESYWKLQAKYRLRITGAVVVVIVIASVAYHVGRRVGRTEFHSSATALKVGRLVPKQRDRM